ncbi:hypothetical protein [Pararhizobium gei]|uniref:hypothetical protein n=1 Tax=Pararhizobium gei TaxID=1395951 RepID=UPI0023DBEF63|nr:hypothetical protein [Rhizobium gei]
MRTTTHALPTDRLALPRRLIPRRPRQAAPFVHPITSDTMAPTYIAHNSSVICLPVDAYVCEGVYLIDGELFRCQRDGNYIEMWRDNPAWTRYRIHLDLFNERALALVVADITARNAIGTDMLRAVAA